MKMTINIKKILITVLGALCCLLAGVALIFAPTFKITAKAAVTTTTDMYCDGASIRLADDGKSGIRFHVRVKANEDGSVTLNETPYSKVDFGELTKGILVIPTDKLSESEELTIEGATTAYKSGARAANPSDLVWSLRSETDENNTKNYFYEATAYVYEIPDSSFDREFSFRGYYVNANGEYVYTEDTDSRCLSKVALFAKIDHLSEESETDYTDYLNILNGYLPCDYSTKFENADTYLYRVGNQNSVSLEPLFKLVENTYELNDLSFTHSTISNVQVDVESVSGDVSIVENGTTISEGVITSLSGNAVQFAGTGVIQLSIYDDYSRPYILTLEVIDAKNLTTATGTTSGGTFVLLNNVNASDYVYYWNSTLYGNGFTYSLNGAPTTYSSSHGHGVIITKNTTLDNLQIVGDIYDEYGAYTTNNDYNAAIDVLGDTVIQNCYISGCSAPISARANATIKNTTLYGGAVGNLIIKGGTVTLEDVTTVNYNDGRELIGMGILVHSDAAEDSKLELNGTLTQYNFIKESDTPTNSYAKNLHSAMFGDSCSGYHFGTSPNRYVNTGIISLTETFDDSNITDNANTGYMGTTVTLSGVSGYVYTQPNTIGSVNNNYNKEDDSHVATEQGAVPPSYSFDYTTKNYVANTEGSNDYCYEADGVVYISMDDGDSFDWDTSILTVKKGTETLDYTVSMNATDYTGKSICFNTAGEYEVVYTYTDENNYKLEDGKAATYSKTYTKTVTILVSVITPETKHAEFTMGSSNAATEKITIDNATYVSATGVTADNSTWTYMTINGQKIYYPIVAAKLTSTKGSSTYAYFPVFENVVTITDYEDNGMGDAFTYNSSTTTLPSTLTAVKGIYKAASDVPYWYNLTNSNLTQSGATNIFKWASSSTAPSDPTTYNNVLCYKSPQVSADRVAYITLVQYSYTDAANTTYYYYVGYTLEAFTKQTTCVTPDTLVTLADGSQKEIQYVTCEEELLVWDFVNGEYAVKPSSIVMNHGYDNYTVVSLTFDDGTVVDTINGHGFFDKDTNEFVVLHKENVQDYVGHNFVKQDVNKTTKLVSYSVREEYTESWSILTSEHYNCMLGGMLTITPAEVEDSPSYLMPFEIGEDMQYDAETMQADIERYGLYTYEDFAEYMTYEQFKALNLSIFKVSVGKGYITWEEILYLISIHIKN